jgi:predicted alpha/beta-fold hydrolase
VTGEASWQAGKRETRPVAIFLHGLEGSARSHYLVGMSRKAFARGFHVVRLNMRNCGGTEHLTPTLYCAGLSQDVLAVVRWLHGLGLRRVYAAAVSLGANILLKFLGEQGDRGGEYLRAAAVMSPPIDLGLGAHKIGLPQNWIYEHYFVRNLIRRMRRKLALYPSLGDMAQIERVRTIVEFDDLVTARHFGFGTAENYYRLASSGPLLGSIRVPTLIVQAQDDPMIPFEPFLTSGIERNPNLLLLATRYGGHTGFLQRRPPGSPDPDAYWGECRIVQFLTAAASHFRDLL